jgi:hypothetical protein
MPNRLPRKPQESIAGTLLTLAVAAGATSGRIAPQRTQSAPRSVEIRFSLEGAGLWVLERQHLRRSWLGGQSASCAKARKLVIGTLLKVSPVFRISIGFSQVSSLTPWISSLRENIVFLLRWPKFLPVYLSILVRELDSFCRGVVEQHAECH